ncbi:MAG: RNA methyltransferase [Acidiferrobacterales bacterium]|jgi:TrmH family RNA methyltransferase
MSLSNIRIVLVHPTHPGNVGAAARAMKTMGLEAFYLVAPVDYQGPEAWARAAGADDVLAGAVTSDSLGEALRGCSLVIGTSSRARAIPWPALDPRACAQMLVAASQQRPAALVFGREKMGLTNAELDSCQYVVSIPTNDRYSSLNLACAVQVMSYEILRASQAQPEVTDIDWHEPEVPPASGEDRERFYRHLEAVLVEIGFLDPTNPRKLMRRLVRLFNRMALDVNELNILRGILTAVQRSSGQTRRPG